MKGNLHFSKCINFTTIYIYIIQVCIKCFIYKTIFHALFMLFCKLRLYENICFFALIILFFISKILFPLISICYMTGFQGPPTLPWLFEQFFFFDFLLCDKKKKHSKNILLFIKKSLKQESLLKAHYNKKNSLLSFNFNNQF